MIEAGKKDDNIVLARVPYIYYLVCFKKDKILALINLRNKVNVMTLAYILKLDLKTYYFNIRAQKIDYSTLIIFKITLVFF